MIAPDSEENISLCSKVCYSSMMTILSAGAVALTTWGWSNEDDAVSIGVDTFLILADIVVLGFTGLMIYDTTLHCRGMGPYATIVPDGDLV
jgi:hypothetical protein